jgi:predicted DNA-binding transcriptional regulator AlpA
MSQPPIAATSIPDLARSIGVSRSKLYEMIQRGEGPPVVRLGRRAVVLVEDGRAWIQSRRRQTPVAA